MAPMKPTFVYNAWQFRQILGRGAHGVLLCQAETPGAVRAFVESCRYPHNLAGVDPALPTPLARLSGAHAKTPPDHRLLGVGTRGRGSESSAAPIWGIPEPEYRERCDPWPLNPHGELLLGIKLESPEGVARCEEILAVPGIGFAEMGPGDLSLALGYREMPREVYPPEMAAARERVFQACRRNRVAFLEIGGLADIAAKLDEGVRVIAGADEAVARAGRTHSRRLLPA
jgi:4-hydroxy-2-oxoheptanedioate aldolase